MPYTGWSRHARRMILYIFIFPGMATSRMLLFPKTDFCCRIILPAPTMYNAVRIEDLNKIANTLSARNNGKVILITDACHSGKLAGNDSRGNFLAAEQLRKVKANEIRITSCTLTSYPMKMKDGVMGGVFSPIIL